MKQHSAFLFIVQASKAACATPAGPARAGKVGELSCAGGFYRGEVLAGQPHGKGQFFTMLVRQADDCRSLQL